MPLYFFDVTDTGQTSRDDEGAEFATVEQARREALRALGGIARDELAKGGDREFIIRIREAANGSPILSASLSLHIQKHDPASN